MQYSGGEDGFFFSYTDCNNMSSMPIAFIARACNGSEGRRRQHGDDSDAVMAKNRNGTARPTNTLSPLSRFLPLFLRQPTHSDALSVSGTN